MCSLKPPGNHKYAAGYTLKVFYGLFQKPLRILLATVLHIPKNRKPGTQGHPGPQLSDYQSKAWDSLIYVA